MDWKEIRFPGFGGSSKVSVLACRPMNIGEIPTYMKEAAKAGDGVIAYGSGYSYGALNSSENGRVLMTTHLDRIHSFKEETGEIVCEPGVSFHDLLTSFLPRGFLCPVMPSSRFITVGGAVATNIYGQNQENDGNFGDHVVWIDLVLPSYETVRISKTENPDLFQATIGGLGLTGVIARVCFTMRRVSSSYVTLKQRRAANFDALLKGVTEARRKDQFVSAWIDCLSSGSSFGRGILETAEFADPSSRTMQLRIPRIKLFFKLPGFISKPWLIRLWNSLYYRHVPQWGRTRTMSAGQFFHPTDSLGSWNKLYGRVGLFNFHASFPEAEGPSVLRNILLYLSTAKGQALYGRLQPLGVESSSLLSFTQKGYALSLVFPANPASKETIQKLENLTMEHKGRIYLAKGELLGARNFHKMYPKASRFEKVLSMVDPSSLIISDMALQLGLKGKKAKKGKGAKGDGNVE